MPPIAMIKATTTDTPQKAYSCEECRFWSDLVAEKPAGCWPIRAMCLSPRSPLRGEYTEGFERCGSWTSGHLGAIDDPDQDPMRYAKERCE